MVFQIYYGDKRPRTVLFDIEIFCKSDEFFEAKGMKEHYFVELHSDAFISGTIDFLKEKLKDDNFNLKEFKNDCENIEELRRWLWEQHDNKLRSIEDASKDKSKWTTEVKEMLMQFCNKYGIYINED